MDSDHTRILMFHRVLDHAPAAFDLPSCYRLRGTALTVSEMIQRIEQSGRIISLSAVEEALARGEAPPIGEVLTFDDGYREHLDIVAPLLAERGIPATFYVATGLHGDSQNVATVDAWYWLLDNATAKEARVLLPGGGEFRGRIDTTLGKMAWVGGEPKAALLAATATQQASMVAELAESTEAALPADLAARLYLRPSEWGALVALGMRVGAHSIHHPRLTQVDPTTLQAEVQGSVQAIAHLGGPVAFAYPDGATNERVAREVRHAGVSSSVTCEPGEVVRGVDRMGLPRTFIRPPAG